MIHMDSILRCLAVLRTCVYTVHTFAYNVNEQVVECQIAIIAQWFSKDRFLFEEGKKIGLKNVIFSFDNWNPWSLSIIH